MCIFSYNILGGMSSNILYPNFEKELSRRRNKTPQKTLPDWCFAQPSNPAD
jgi:hypothetical protein